MFLLSILYWFNLMHLIFPQQFLTPADRPGSWKSIYAHSHSILKWDAKLSFQLMSHFLEETPWSCIYKLCPCLWLCRLSSQKPFTILNTYVEDMIQFLGLILQCCSVILCLEADVFLPCAKVNLAVHTNVLESLIFFLMERYKNWRNV